MLTEEEIGDGQAEPRQGRTAQGQHDREVGAARPQVVQADGADRPLGGLGLLEVNRRVRVFRGLGVASSQARVQNPMPLPCRVQIEVTQQQEDRQDESPVGSPHEHGEAW